MPQTALIFNPAAKSARAGGLYGEIRRLAGPGIRIFRTSRQGEARSIARWAVREGFERIIASGGDGTINEVVNGIAGSDAVLGILPTGTMNVFAAELGLPKNLEDAWAIISRGEYREIDLPIANGHAFVQLAGIGLDAQAVKETTWEFKQTLGPLSYLISAAQITARKPPHLIATGDDGVAREGSFILIGNGRYYGGPFPVFKDARIDDRLLNVLIFKNLGYLDIMRYLGGILRGSHVTMPDVEYFLTHELHVCSDEEVPIEVDGEVIGNLPAQITFHPKPLRVLAPPCPRALAIPSIPAAPLQP